MTTTTLSKTNTGIIGETTYFNIMDTVKRMRQQWKRIELHLLPLFPLFPFLAYCSMSFDWPHLQLRRKLQPLVMTATTLSLITMENREAYEWMLSVGWEKTIKPVLEKMIEDLRAERERETDPEKIYIQDRALEVWNDVLEGGEPFIRWLLIEDHKLLRQKIESKDSQKQVQEQEHQVMKIGSGELYSMCLEECKKYLGTHEHCHSPCSKFANSFGRRQKTDETDENLKEALERLLEEYLREEEGQS